MSPINFASSNKEKFIAARHICETANIPIQQVILDIDEIQGEDPLLIVKAKAVAAYEKLEKPVVVSDDSWDIPALNGFPGAYMKSMNHWFTPDNFLDLTRSLVDKAVVLHQYLAFFDGQEYVVFDRDIRGRILDTSHDDTSKPPWMNVVTLEGDNGKSLAEVFAQDEAEIVKRYQKHHDVWQDLIDWYKQKMS